jgi:hypothetical protein
MPRSPFKRIANWGAVQAETGPVTAQVLRRIVGSGGDGRGGVIESAIMNIYRTTNVFGGDSGSGLQVPLRLIGSPPPQLIIGYNDATVWRHGVQSDGNYVFGRGETRDQNIYFELTSDGKVSIQNPGSDTAWLNIKNPGVDEADIAAMGPALWIDANDPIGDGTAPADITDGTDIESLSSGHWTDKGSHGGHVTSSFAAGSQPKWYKVAGSSPAPSVLPNGKPVVSTIPGGVGSDNFTAWQGTTFTVFAVFWHHDSLSRIIGSNSTIGAGNKSALVAAQSSDDNAGESGELRFENLSPNTNRWTYLGDSPATSQFVWASWISGTGEHKINGTVMPISGTDGSPSGFTQTFEEWFQTTINTGSIQRTSAWYAEIIVFPSELSAADQARVVEYLESKWAVGTGGSGGDSNPVMHVYDTADSVATEINEQGWLHVGGENPSAPLHATRTSEQARLGYDASNYVSFTVASDGSLTMDLVGTTPEFTLSDDVNITGDLTVTKTAAQARLAYDASNYVDFEVGSAGDLSITPTPAGSDVRLNYDASNYVKFEVSSSGDVTVTPTGGDLALVANLNLTGVQTITSTTDPQLRLKYDANSYIDFGMLDTAMYMGATASSALGDGTRIFSYSPIWIRQDFGGGPLTGPDATANDLVIASSDNQGGGDVGISLICGDTTSVGRIHFGDNLDGSPGYVAYAHSNNTLYLHANGFDCGVINNATFDIQSADTLLTGGDLYFASKTTGSRIYYNAGELVIVPDFDSNVGGLDIQGFCEITSDNATKSALVLDGPSGATYILEMWGDSKSNDCFRFDDNGVMFGYDGIKEMKFTSRSDDDGLTPHDSFHFQAGSGNPLGDHTTWLTSGAATILDLPHAAPGSWRPGRSGSMITSRSSWGRPETAPSSSMAPT